MSQATSIHELRTLIRSFHPVIVIETVEEARVGDLLHAVCSELGMDHFTWSINRGLERQPSGEAHATQWTTDPFQLLAHLEKMTLIALGHLPFAPVLPWLPGQTVRKEQLPAVFSS